MKTVIEKVKTLKSVGYFPKDNFKGELAKQWNAKLKELEIDQVCSVVWCDVMWCGVLWCGVLWCVVTCVVYSVVKCGIVFGVVYSVV